MSGSGAGDAQSHVGFHAELGFKFHSVSCTSCTSTWAML